MGIIFTKVLGNTAFYFPIVFNHSLTWFGRVDLKNALTSWVYFSCNNYCCVKEKQTKSPPAEWLADSAGSLLDRTHGGWLVSALGLSGEHVKVGVTWWLDPCGSVFTPIMRILQIVSWHSFPRVAGSPHFKCPHVAWPCGLSMWACLGFFTGRQVSSIVRVKREAGRRSCAIFYELAVKST